MKNRVTGIGGIFFKSEDPNEAKAWYKKHLGLNTDDYGCTFWWKIEIATTVLHNGALWINKQVILQLLKSSL